MSSLNRLKTSVLLLVLVGLTVYFNSLLNGFILGDDTDQVVENVQIRTLTNIPSFFTGSTYFRQESNQAFGLYYKPIMMIVYTIVYSLAAADPLLFHLVQVVLFLATGVLLLVIFRRFFSPALAWFLAALFLVHPANSESVLFVSALQDVLYMFFGLLAIVFLLKKQRLTGNSWMVVVGIFLLLSLFSKETGVIFLVLSSLFVAFFHKENTTRVILLSGILLLVYAVFRFGIANIGFGEQAIARISQASFSERLLNIPLLLTNYILLFIFPAHLEIHQNWLVTQATRETLWIPLVILAAIVSGLFFLWRYLRINKPSLLSPFYIFLIWTVTGFLPHMQLIPLDVTLAERWMIAPIVGLLGIVGIAVTAFHKILRPAHVWLGVCCVILLVLSARTFVRSMDWRSSETLFTHDLRTAQDNYYLENLYASLLLQEGKVSEAEPYVRSSVEAYPFLSNLSNMAIILLKQGKYDEAQEYFERSLSKQYIYPAVQNYVNFLVFIKKDNPKAKEIIQKYLPQYSGAGPLWMTLALAEHGLGNTEEATKASGKAYALSPIPIVEEVHKALSEGREPDLQKYLTE